MRSFNGKVIVWFFLVQFLSMQIVEIAFGEVSCDYSDPIWNGRAEFWDENEDMCPYNTGVTMNSCEVIEIGNVYPPIYTPALDENGKIDCDVAAIPDEKEFSDMGEYNGIEFFSYGEGDDLREFMVIVTTEHLRIRQLPHWQDYDWQSCPDHFGVVGGDSWHIKISIYDLVAQIPNLGDKDNYNHIGDVDVHYNSDGMPQIFMPFEYFERSNDPLVAVFTVDPKKVVSDGAAALEYTKHYILEQQANGTLAWLAIFPLNPNLLFTSDEIGDLAEYGFKQNTYNRSEHGDQWSSLVVLAETLEAQGIGCADVLSIGHFQTLTLGSTALNVYDLSGDQATGEDAVHLGYLRTEYCFNRMQGGDFSPNGMLFLANDLIETGFRILNIYTGETIGEFDAPITTGGVTVEEYEGVAVHSVSGGTSTNDDSCYPGTVHLEMSDNDAKRGSKNSDDLYLKHYSLSSRAITQLRNVDKDAGRAH